MSKTSGGSAPKPKRNKKSTATLKPKSRATTAKKVTKTTTRAKSTPKKSVARKTKTNKPVAKKTTRAKAVKKPAAKTTSAQKPKVGTKTKQDSDTKTKTKTEIKDTQPLKGQKSPNVDSAVVTLPKRMSIRAREKALVLADTFEKDFYVPGLTLAKVGGFCFILIGFAATYTQLQPTFEPEFCLGATCTAAVSNSNDADQADTDGQQSNYAKLLSNVPTTITTVTDISFEISNVTRVSAYLSFVTENGTKHVPYAATATGNNKYKVTIDPTQLDPTQYALKLRVVHTDTEKEVYYSLADFSIVLKDANEADTPPSNLDDDTSDKTDEGTTTTNASDQEQDSQTSESDFGVSYVQDDSVVKKVTNTKPDSNGELPNTVIPPRQDEPIRPVDMSEVEPESKAPVTQKLRLIAQSSLSGVATLQLENFARYTNIKLYVRQLQSLNSQQIGTMVVGRDTFRFDTTTFPSGSYELYAQGFIDQKPGISNTIKVEINNKRPLSTDNQPTPTQQREYIRASDELPAPSRVNPQRATSSFVVSARERALLRLSADSSNLDEYLRAYAAAVQTGDQALINKAKEAIQAYRGRIVADALGSTEDRFIARELDESLGEELEKLQVKVRTFESVRRERTEANSAIDTDGDGISDMDERLLYKTDPLNPDSDNDGFTDGAEIVKGFNPNDAAIEAIIAFESPRDVVGVIKTDKLQVLEVLPDVQLASLEETNVVKTVVRGKGLPNSFVTLYVFSTPTIVTVKTEADGSFEYTFSQELEDGEHQVFVALTDNTGEIVAQSEGFSFIKEAEAFTAVDTQDATATLNSPVTTSDSSPYRIALAMSVLALGVLLILLGLGLRSNKPTIVIRENETA